MLTQVMNVPKYQAEAIRLYLENSSPLDDIVTMIVIPWGNGRETCYASMFHRGYREKTLIVVYGEHRSSDGIFVDHWFESQVVPVEFVTYENDNYEEAYKNRAMFEFGRIDQVVDYIWDLAESWFEELPKSS